MSIFPSVNEASPGSSGPSESLQDTYQRDANSSKCVPIASYSPPGFHLGKGSGSTNRNYGMTALHRLERELCPDLNCHVVQGSVPLTESSPPLPEVLQDVWRKRVT